MAIRNLLSGKKLDQALARLAQHPLPEPRPLREATTAQPTTEDWYWGRLGSTGTDEDYFWRRLSDNWTQKDVIPATYVEIHNQCYGAYNANPMANAIIEMGTNFVLGDGMQIDARNKMVQKIIDAFWDDSDNHMNLRQYDLVTELALYGELFLRFFHICCDSPDWVSHVGIYVGNGMMIDAPYPGAYVRMESINTPYWQSHFLSVAASRVRGGGDRHSSAHPDRSTGGPLHRAPDASGR